MFFDTKFELNVLINLAAIDHIIEAREARLIHMIGAANQLSKEEIEEMIRRPEPISGFGVMTPEEKFDHLCYLIRMMKADGRVITDEIEFCEIIAERLGYKKGVVRELSAHIYSDPTVHSNRDLLQKKAERFLRN
jgi:hypothetical protein